MSLRRCVGIFVLCLWLPAAEADSSIPPAPAGTGAFAVNRLQGPYASLDAVCVALRGEATQFACSKEPAARLANPPSPYREVIVLRARELAGPDNPHEIDQYVDSHDLHLAIRLDAGWFVAPEIAVLEDLWNHGGGRHVSVKIESRAPRSLGSPLLVVLVRSEQELKWTSATLERLVVAGVGRSGTPSSIGPVLLSERGTGERKEGPDFRFDRSFAWHLNADGALVIRRGRGDRSWIHAQSADVAAALGTHALAFP